MGQEWCSKFDSSAQSFAKVASKIWSIGEESSVFGVDGVTSEGETKSPV